MSACLGSRFPEKAQEVLVDSELNMSQGCPLATKMINSNLDSINIESPVTWHLLDHIEILP